MPARGLVSGLASKCLPEAAFARCRPVFLRLDALIDTTNSESAPQRKAIYIFAMRLLGAALAYVFQILLARWLGAHEFGIFVVVWTWVIMLSTLVAFGFDSAVIRLLPEYDEAGDQRALRGVLAASRFITLVASTLLVLVAIAGVWLFSDIVTAHYIIPLYLGFVCLPLMALMDVQEGIAKAYDWFDLALIPTYILRPLAILGFVALAGVLAEEQTAEWALTAAIGGTYLIALAQFAALRWRLGADLTHGPRRFEISAWFKLALPILAIDGFFVMLTSTDVLVASYFVDPREVAIYHVALKTLAIAHFVYFAIRSVSGHRFSRLYHSGDKEGLASFATLSVKLSFWPTLFICGGFLSGGDFLLSLFGEAYRAGYPLMAVLTIGILARATVGPAASLLAMCGHQTLCAQIYALTFFVNLVLNIVAVMAFGLVGAALATSLSLILETIAVNRAVQRKLGINLCVFTRKATIGPSYTLDKVPPTALSAWRDLSAFCPNTTALNTLDGLLPQLTAFGGKSARLLCLSDPDIDRSPPNTLTGIVGIHKTAPLGGLTGQLPALWSSEFGPLGTPLLAAGFEAHFLQELFDATGATSLLLPYQYLDSESWLRIEAAAQSKGYDVRRIDEWQRAVLHPRRPTVFRAAMSGRHQKEMRRLWRRLCDEGEASLETARTPEMLVAAKTQFLALEASGWKGAARTALSSTPERQAFVADFLAGFEHQGGLTIDQLTVGERTIASLITLSAHRHAVTWKIAFDQAYAKFSPGLLLMNEVTNRLLNEAQFDVVDSLATPDHPMIDRLWPDKVRIGHVLISTSPPIGRFRAAEFQAKKRLKAAAKQILRRAARPSGAG